MGILSAQLKAGSVDQETHDWVKRSFPNALRIPPIQGHESAIQSIVYTANGMQIVTGSQDHSLRIWNARTGALSATLKGHVAGITCIAISTSESSSEIRIVSGSSDGTVRLWSLAEERDIAGPLKRNETRSSITSVAISPDGSRVASSSGDGTVLMWEAPSGRPIGRPNRESSRRVEQLALSRDGVLGVFSTTRSHYTFSTFKSSNGRATNRPTGRHPVPWRNDINVTASALSSNWNRAALGFSNGEVGVLEISSASFVAYQHGWNPVRHIVVEAVAFSPNDSRIASSCDGTLQIHDLNTKKFIGSDIRLVANPLATRAIAFHPEGHTIATGSDDRYIRVWDATGSWRLFSFAKHKGLSSRAGLRPAET